MSFHQWLETQLADIRQAQLDAMLQGNNPMIHPELNMDTQPPEPKKTFAEKLGTAIAIIISIALAALVVTLVIACIALIWSLMLEQHLI